jgi:hypothetical protein
MQLKEYSRFDLLPWKYRGTYNRGYIRWIAEVNEEEWNIRDKKWSITHVYTSYNQLDTIYGDTCAFMSNFCNSFGVRYQICID